MTEQAILNKIFKVANILNISSLKSKFRLINKSDPTPVGYKCAAVIIPLIDINDQINIIFTKRSALVNDHRNQISFPGGVCEDIDSTNLDTALRELYEEIGIKISFESVFGALEARKSITGYFITPFIAHIDTMQEIRPNPAEVEKIIYVPLEWLANPGNYSLRPYSRDGIEEHNVLFYKPYMGETIWGITAKILNDFLSEIKK